MNKTINNGYFTVLESVSDGYFILNRDSSIYFVSPSYKELLGCTESDIDNLSIEHIDLTSSLYVLADDNTLPHTFMTKHLTFDKSELIVEVTCFYDTHYNDKIVCVVRDLTCFFTNKQNSEIIEKIFKNSNEAIAVTDNVGTVKLVNDNFTKISGYSIADIVGKNLKVLNSGRQSAEFYKYFWKDLKTDGNWSGEIWNKRKNGEIFPEWLNITNLRNDEGEITHYIAQFIDLTEKKEVEKRQKYQAYHDHLTLLPNRRLLFERLESLVQHSDEFSILFCDLDNFKNVNDSYGHSVGDEVLKAVSNRIQKHIRSTDTLARTGGDEFIIVIEGAKDNNAIDSITEQILSAFQQPFSSLYGDFYITCSIGVSHYPLDSINIRELISFADIAMYRVKNTGGNNVCFFDCDQKKLILHQIELENIIHEAVVKNQFEVWYQPQINSKTEQVYGLECLVRWRHPEHGLIGPDVFIPILEKNGLIKEVGLFVLKTGVSQYLQWKRDNVFSGRLAINASMRQFDGDVFINEIEHLLENSYLPPSALEIEVTESLFSDDAKNYIDKLNLIKDLGINIAIDDFGTGYSSLSRLKGLPINNLKIDKSFVDDITTNPESLSLINVLILLAKTFKLEVIAEGIESQEQAVLLSEVGCYNHQGYLYSKPKPADELTQWLVNYKVNPIRLSD